MAFNPSNIIGAYDLDGNGNDASGNANHLPDSAGSPAYGSGAQGTMVALSKGDWIGKTGSAGPWQIGTANRGFAFWALLDSASTTYTLAITGALTNGDEGYNLLAILGSTDRLRTRVSDGVARVTNTSSNPGLVGGSYQHIVFNLRPADSETDLYLDGVFIATIPYPYPVTDIGSTDDIFRLGASGVNGIDGELAQAIVNGDVFSTDDIDAMYNGGTRLTYDELLPAGSGSGELPGSGSGEFGSGSGSGVLGSGSGVIGSGSGEPDPCESLIFNASQAVKLQTLKTYVEGILANHTNGGTWRVNELVTAHLLGLQSRFDFKDVFGDPVRWCRMAPVDQPDAVDNVDDIRDVHNSTVLVTHEYEIILQYQFEEADAFPGSTTEEWYNVLWGECPDGILTSFNHVGAILVDDGSGEIIQVNKPNTIALPTLPLVAFGSDLAGDGEQVLIHHVDFRVQLT